MGCIYVIANRETGPHSAERIAAIVAGMSAEGRERTRLANVGLKRSEETRQRMRDAWDRRKAKAAASLITAS